MASGLRDEVGQRDKLEDAHPRSTGNRSVGPVNLGCIIPTEKWMSMKFPNLVSNSGPDCVGLNLVRIDPLKSLDSQTECCTIIHKLHDWLVEDGGVSNKADFDRAVGKFLEQVSRKGIRLIDPWNTVVTVNNRNAVLSLVDECWVEVNGIRMCAPPFAYVGPGISDSELKLLLQSRGINFPFIAKPPGGFFPEHRYDMSIHFSDLLEDSRHSIVEQLKFIPCVIQQFYNHGGLMYKCYIVGNKWQVIRRVSIDDLNFSRRLALYFRSNQISRKQPALGANGVCCPELLLGTLKADDSTGLDETVIQCFIDKLREKLDFGLLGLDIVAPLESVYYVVDVNYFPGYKDVSNLPELFTNLCKDAALTRDSHS